MAIANDLDRATDSTWDWVAQQTRLYLASGGTEGHESNGVYTLVLATTGRRTGEPRRTCLIYGTSGDDFVVVASKGGADQDPDWFKNLRAEPGRRGPGRHPPVHRPRPCRVLGRARGPLAPDGAHLPAVQRVRAGDRPRDSDRPAHSPGLTCAALLCPAPKSCHDGGPASGTTTAHCRVRRRLFRPR